MPLPTQVAIVAAGGIGGLETTKEYAAHLTRILNRAMTGGTKSERKFEAQIVADAEEALRGPLQFTAGGTLVFLSVTELRSAKEVAAKHGRRIKVVVLTGSTPNEGEPIIIRKQWLNNLDDFGRFID